MNKLRLLVIVFFTAVFSVNAQSTSNYLWMVSSKSAMIEYALSLITRASASVYSGGSVAEFDCKMTAWAYNKTTDKLDVIGLLKGQNMTFSVARPSEDYIGLYSYIYGVNGDILFHGGNYGKLEKDTSGNWVPPSDILNLKMYLGWSIPIYVPAAVQSKLILRDENGNVVETRYLQMNNGYLLFETQYLGRNADLAVTFDSNGNYITMVASVRDNQSVQADQKSINGPNLSIDGLWDYGEDIDYIDYLTVTLQSQNGRGQSPLLRMKNTYGKSFCLFVKTTEGEKPTGVWVKDAITGEEKHYVYGNVDHIVIDLPHAGIWETILEWKTFDNQNYQYSSWEKG